MLNEFGTIRVAVLTSHRAPGIERLLHHPHRGSLYDVACVITSEPEMLSRVSIEDAGVAVLVHPIRRFHEECGSSLQNIETRRSYDAMTVHALQQLDVTAVLMLGYLYIATDVLLEPYAGRVLNVHDSDLTIIRADGERKYTGLHSTRDAVLAGEGETRSTLHQVTAVLDGGPVIMRSEPYPVAEFARQAAACGQYDVVKAYAWAHREWMMRDCWGDLGIRVLERLAAGEDLARCETVATPEYALPAAIWS